MPVGAALYTANYRHREREITWQKYFTNPALRCLVVPCTPQESQFSKTESCECREIASSGKHLRNLNSALWSWQWPLGIICMHCSSNPCGRCCCTEGWRNKLNHLGRSVIAMGGDLSGCPPLQGVCVCVCVPLSPWPLCG